MNNGRLYKAVVDKIIDLIEIGEFPVGGRLPPERELAERFDVSRPTIREAVIALETLGRVSVRAGSGVYVQDAKLSADQFENMSAFELTEARALFEGEAAALAATMISDEELEQISRTLSDMGGQNNGHEANHEQADKDFHLIIAKATRNNAVSTVIKNLWHIRENSPQVKRVYQSICDVYPLRRVNEHQEIYDALVNRDPTATRAAMHHHFSRLLNKLLAATEAEEVEAARRKAHESRKRFSLDHLLQ